MSKPRKPTAITLADKRAEAQREHDDGASEAEMDEAAMDAEDRYLAYLIGREEDY